MLIGVIGAPNSGKSTFFSAATLVDVPISNRPFTTIKPNQGKSFVTLQCIHNEKGMECQPVNSKCENNLRMIPIKLLDVAGLVPDAWQGKGLGNQFLNDLMQADALIHVLDVSGRTDLEGKPTQGHDVTETVRFLEKEIAHWIKGILTKNWGKISKQASSSKKVSTTLGIQLSGLGISETDVKSVLEKENFSSEPDKWGQEEILRFSEEIRKKSKPILIAANKIDVTGAKENLEILKKEFPEQIIIPCSAESELALRKAAKNQLISYFQKTSSFEILKEVDEKQKNALEFIKKNVLEKWSGTGVQEAINKTAFELLDLIAVYPVQDANKWSSGKGHYLPDTFLLKKDSNALQLAKTIHTDFEKRFIAAVDCRTKQKIGKDHKLKNNDVIKIQLSN